MSTCAPSRRWRPVGAVVLAAAAAVGLAGCSGDHHVLSPKGPEAGRVSALGIGMIAVATGVTVLVFALLVAALLPGDRKGLRRISDHTYVIGGGIVLPLVVLLTLSGLTITALDDTARQGDLQVHVTGHQFWWEVRYPGTGAVTANEIHIPAGRRVRVTLRSDDVIHSFWVPALAGKIDMIPGRTNHLVIQADRPGTYRGQCAEFCGVEHGRMAFLVIADPPAEYQRWIDQQAAPARTVPAAAAGQRAFGAQTCGGCHRIRGTEADGAVGPDLTHLADRRTIGALTLPNDRAHLSDWVANAQKAKPGVAMPPSVLTADQLAAIVTYLGSLK